MQQFHPISQTIASIICSVVPKSVSDLPNIDNQTIHSWKEPRPIFKDLKTIIPCQSNGLLLLLCTINPSWNYKFSRRDSFDPDTSVCWTTSPEYHTQHTTPLSGFSMCFTMFSGWSSAEAAVAITELSSEITNSCFTPLCLPQQQWLVSWFLNWGSWSTFLLLLHPQPILFPNSFHLLHQQHQRYLLLLSQRSRKIENNKRSLLNPLSRKNSIQQYEKRINTSTRKKIVLTIKQQE